MLVVSFQSSLDKLRKTLDLLIPPEFEGLFAEDDESGNTEDNSAD